MNIWAKNAARKPGWPTVGVRYLRNFLRRPLTIQRLRAERPELSGLLLDGFQGASFPISSRDFHTVLELFGEDQETIASDGPNEDATTFDKLAELESKYIYASPEVKTCV